MSLTRAFKSGNSQAIRIPSDLAYADMTQDLEITRSGDVIIIKPVQRGLAAMVAELEALPRPASVEKREAIDVPDRD